MEKILRFATNRIVLKFGLLLITICLSSNFLFALESREDLIAKIDEALRSLQINKLGKDESVYNVTNEAVQNDLQTMQRIQQHLRQLSEPKSNFLTEPEKKIVRDLLWELEFLVRPKNTELSSPGSLINLWNATHATMYPYKYSDSRDVIARSLESSQREAQRALTERALSLSLFSNNCALVLLQFSAQRGQRSP